jgi:hypothetical protein
MSTSDGSNQTLPTTASHKAITSGTAVLPWVVEHLEPYGMASVAFPAVLLVPA